MKIYTKTGDKGETSFFGGTRVKKDHPRIAAYGEIDELNAALGYARSFPLPSQADSVLKKIQNDLFEVGAILASPQTSKNVGSLKEENIVFLEKSIDAWEKDLTPLKQFILPGGAPAAAWLQVARAICRRAERKMVALGDIENKDLVTYVNRLSDLLFVLARWVNHKQGGKETVWEKKT